MAYQSFGSDSSFEAEYFQSPVSSDADTTENAAEKAKANEYVFSFDLLCSIAH
jgi:hypothetical protein